MAIQRILRLRRPGVFHDFSWPSNLLNFGRYNLIYGWNGSGKTTISKVFRDLELRKAPESGGVTLSINGSNIKETDFPDTTQPIRVFNRDFVAENVFPFHGVDVPPILVVGKESIGKQKEVERLKTKLSEIDEALDKTRKEKYNRENQLDKHCIDTAKLIKETLRSSGNNPYNNYDKSNYRQAIRDAEELVLHPLNSDEYDRELAQHRAVQEAKLTQFRTSLPISLPKQRKLHSC